MTSTLVILPTTRTILGSLTTTFTQPTGCTTPYVGIAIGGLAATAQNFYQGQFCNGNLGLNDASSCWPATTSMSATTGPPLLGWGFYSPGYICPAGYTTACKMALLNNSSLSTLPSSQSSLSFIFQFALVAGETAVGCCPTGYTCGNGGGYGSYQTCRLTTATTAFTGAVCLSSGSSTPALITIPATTTTAIIVSRPTVLSATAATMYAPLIQVNFKASDLPSSISTTTSTTRSTSTSTSTSAAAAVTGTYSLAPGGLSTGAKIGIGVAIPLVVLAAIAALLFFLFRRRRSRKQQPSPASEHDIMLPYRDGGHNELPGSGIAKSSSIKKAPVEMPVENEVHELDASPVAQEMESTHPTAGQTLLRGGSPPIIERGRLVD